MSDTPSSATSSQAQLVSDIKAVIADAEEILGATADQGGEKISALRARIQERLRDARTRLAAAEAVLLDKTRAAARATDGIGAGVGFLLGLILGRR